MNETRVVFLDWLRLVACLMVMVVHACEAFYFNDAGELCFRSLSDARWACWVDAAGRAAVPLFVMASSYLLFPLRRPTGDFFRRRLARVALPFFAWSLVYVVWNAWTPASGLDGAVVCDGLKRLAFNFPTTAGGHLWFVPMLLGLYLLMPLLSPWAEKATEREVRGWLALWLFTTTFPFLRKLWAALFASGVDAASGAFWAHTFGSASFGDLPFLWGECPWNGFGMFHYVSGFFGYLLLGLYFRKFVPALDGRRTLAWALPLWCAGYALVGAFFYFRIPFDGAFPLTRPYALAVDLETSWEFCGLGMALTVVGAFLVLRRLDGGGALYARLVRPVSEASYGVYLMHMLVLPPVLAFCRTRLPTPAAIFASAAATFVLSSLFAVAVRRLPKVGRLLV